jgi:hypothetical protein
MAAFGDDRNLMRLSQARAEAWHPAMIRDVEALQDTRTDVADPEGLLRHFVTLSGA